jgi:hypothetical protein
MRSGGGERAGAEGQCLAAPLPAGAAGVRLGQGLSQGYRHRHHPAAQGQRQVGTSSIQ